MTRRQKDPLHPLSAEEREVLERISRAQSDPASHVARAKALLAVADGASYTRAAQAAGRRSGDAVAQLVARFNQEGLPPRTRGFVTEVDRRLSTDWKNASAFWPSSSVHPTGNRTGQTRGR